jgi:hypothetical protein
MEITKVAVAGAGTMGRGIAQIVAQAGIPVTLIDREESILEQAMGNIRIDLDRAVERERITQDEADVTVSLIDTDTLLESASDANLVIEAIPENLKLKSDLFRRLDEICGATTVLASNTSSIPAPKTASFRSPRFWPSSPWPCWPDAKASPRSSVTASSLPPHRGRALTRYSRRRPRRYPGHEQRAELGDPGHRPFGPPLRTHGGPDPARGGGTGHDQYGRRAPSGLGTARALPGTGGHCRGVPACDLGGRNLGTSRPATERGQGPHQRSGVRRRGRRP